MTRQDYINNYIDAYSGDFDDWAFEHQNYIETGMRELKEYFDADSFIYKYEKIASRELLETLLVDTWYDYNYENGEFENRLARYMSTSIRDICAFRTEKFWDEIVKEAQEEEEERE